MEKDVYKRQDFPLKHPRYVIENVAYKESVYRIMGWDRCV